jgi:LPXTG-site transpeptidase (sortase) family protein
MTAGAEAVGQAPREHAPPPAPIWRQMASTAVLILSVTLLGFAGYVGFVSRLHYDRAQHDAYADFRVQLAQATAPVGPTQPTNPKALLDPGTSVAVLDIPQIGLHAVVLEGTTGMVLENGPGHLRDTVLPGQAGVSEILGRAATYGGPFGRLGQLLPGQIFTVTTGQGVARYLVLDVRRAHDPELPAPAAGKGRLVLATADGWPYLPSDVLRVDADLISTAQPAVTPAFTAATLPDSEQVLRGDSGAWIPLVLWGQGLLLAAAVITWARTRWGRWQVWVVAVPVLCYFGLAVADQAAGLLLNLT